MSTRFGTSDPAATYSLLNLLDDDLLSIASRLPYAVAIVSATWTFSSANNATATVNLPAGRFTVAPIGFVISTSTVRYVAQYASSTTSTITTTLRTADASNITLAVAGYVLAVQMRSNAALG